MANYWGGTIPWVTPGEVTTLKEKTLRLTNESITDEGLRQSGANRLPAGSLLVTTRASLGYCAINSVPVTTNQGFKSIVFRQSSNPDFYYHWTRKISSELKRRASGTTFLEISGSDFKQIKLPVPPSAEQQKIAQILDTLDTQIQKTEALIAKLEKIKEGLLHDLLTRGIDQNGQLRPTPDQAPELYKESALGFIPKEWEVEYLGNLSESGLLNGVFKQPSRVGRGVPLINVADLYKGNSVNLETCERFDASTNEVSKYSARGGDIFVTRSSLKLEGIAHCNWLNHDVPDNSIVYECHVIRVRPVLKVDPHFLVSWCQSQHARRHLMANAKQVTMTTISQDGIASLKCPVPPLPEQRAAFEQVKTLEDRIENELSVLKKIRHEKAGLMDDLLTGRVRVTPLLTNS